MHCCVHRITERHGQSRHDGSLCDSASRVEVAGGGTAHFNVNLRLPGSIGMGYADGHAESPKLEQLWSFYWHLN